MYGEKLTIKHGKLHGYLGMDPDYSEEQTVKVSMIKYVGKITKACIPYVYLLGIVVNRYEYEMVKPPASPTILHIGVGTSSCCHPQLFRQGDCGLSWVLQILSGRKKVTKI